MRRSLPDYRNDGGLDASAPIDVAAQQIDGMEVK
jgi:hypothetical protein